VRVDRDRTFRRDLRFETIDRDAAPFEPGCCALTLANRILVSPMCQY
jgi:hypothetical protein